MTIGVSDADSGSRRSVRQTSSGPCSRSVASRMIASGRLSRARSSVWAAVYALRTVYPFGTRMDSSERLDDSSWLAISTVGGGPAPALSSMVGRGCNRHAPAPCRRKPFPPKRLPCGARPPLRLLTLRCDDRKSFVDTIVQRGRAIVLRPARCSRVSRDAVCAWRSGGEPIRRRASGPKLETLKSDEGLESEKQASMLCRRCEHRAWSARMVRFWSSPQSVWSAARLSDLICARCGGGLPLDLLTEPPLRQLNQPGPLWLPGPGPAPAQAHP